MFKSKRVGGTRRRRRGVEVIEFALVFLPMMAFIFLLIDLGWAIFKRATMQFAVREGCRYAVTNQVNAGLKNSNGSSYGMVDSVKWVVQASSLGFLGHTTSDPGWNLIQVRFYDPTSSLTTALPLPANCADTTTAAPNWAGNLVEVSIENYQSKALAPLMRSATPLNFVVRSADRMEGNPIAGVPNTLTCP